MAATPEKSPFDRKLWSSFNMSCGTTGNKIDAIQNLSDQENHVVQEKGSSKIKKKLREFLVRDSDESQDDDEDNEENEEEELADGEKPYKKHSFLMNSVMDVDDYESGDSMDSEERVDIEENEIAVDGESLGSNDTDTSQDVNDGENDDDKDSFIIDDNEEEFLSTDNEEEVITKKRKNIRLLVDSNDEEEKEEEKAEEKEEKEEEEEKVEEKITIIEYNEKSLNNSKQALKKRRDSLANEELVANKETNRRSISQTNKNVIEESPNKGKKDYKNISVSKPKDSPSGATEVIENEKEMQKNIDEHENTTDEEENEEENDEIEDGDEDNDSDDEEEKMELEINTSIQTSQSFTESSSKMFLNKIKRKRMSQSFCELNASKSEELMRHKHKKSKLALEDEKDKLQNDTETTSDTKTQKKNVKTPERIMAYCAEILEAANRAKLEAKLKAKQQNQLKKPHSKKQKSQEVIEENEEISKSTAPETETQTETLEKTKEALQKALKASTNILLKEEEKNKKVEPKPKHVQMEEKIHAKLLPQEILDAVAEKDVKIKNKKQHVDQEENVGLEQQINQKLLTAAGEVLEQPGTPPPKKKKKLQVEEIETITGIMRVEPATPKDAKRNNSTKAGALRESPTTPHSLSFKVRKLLGGDQDKPPEFLGKNKSGNKRKQSNTDTSAQPQWTTSGVFKVEEKKPTMRAASGMKIIVASSAPKGIGGKHKPKQKYPVANYTLDCNTNAMQFKKRLEKKIIKGAPRVSSMNLLQSKKRSELTRRF